MSKVRFGIIGAGRRAREVYAPLIRILADNTELVAVCSRRLESAKSFGDKFAVPYYTDVSKMVEKEGPDAVIVVVSYKMNGPIGVQVADLGVNMILETPIAAKLSDADVIIEKTFKSGAKVEIAEENFRLPMERLKLKLIEKGIFGKINMAYNDFLGHSWWGMSVIRSYIGWDENIKRVFGFRRKFRLASHLNQEDGTPGPEEELWTHGLIEFENGAVGGFDFSNAAFYTPIRWYRSSKFLGEKGMAVGDDLSILDKDKREKKTIRIERKVINVDGVEVTEKLIAHTDPPLVWENPLKNYPLEDEKLSVADVIMSMVRTIREDGEPEYGPIQGRKDQEANLAMIKSAKRGGIPVELPLVD